MKSQRITNEMIDCNIIEEAYYVWPGTTVTSCLLTLKNGYNVSGESACVDPDNFDEKLGRKIARQNAKEKIWGLMGYALKDRLYEIDGEKTYDIND